MKLTLRKYLIAALITPLLAIAGGFWLPVAAHAQVAPEQCSEPAYRNSAFCRSVASQPADGDAFTGEDGLLLRVARMIATVVGVVSVIVIVIAGLQYALASGDSAKINDAKNAIIFAIVGLVVALIAQGIILFVVGSL